MALRLRRGTNAERQLITPAEGEIVYTTDTKLLYVGDGSTVGGVPVGGGEGGGSATLSGLTDVDATDVADNQVLTWIAGTNKWEPTTLPGVGALTLDELSDVVVGTPTLDDVLSYDGLNWVSRSIASGNPSLDDLSNVVIVDAQYNQVLAFDGANWSSIRSEDTITRGTNLNINIVGDDSTVLVNATSGVFTGNLNGDVLGNVIGDVVGDVVGDLTGDVLGNVLGNVTGNIDGTVFGNVFGNVIGDVKGSVVGDDSTILVDSVASRIVGNVNNEVTTSQTINGGTLQLSGVNSVGLKAGIEIITDGSADDDYSLFNISGRNNSATGQVLGFERGRGTHQIPARLLNGDEITSLVWFGLDNNVNPTVSAAMRISVSGATGVGIVPGKIEFATADLAGDIITGLAIDSNQVIGVADNTVAANSGSGTADVTGGVVSYLKIKVDGVERAIPLYGIVP